MGQAEIHVDAMAGATPLAYEGGGPTGLAAKEAGGRPAKWCKSLGSAPA